MRGHDEVGEVGVRLDAGLGRLLREENLHRRRVCGLHQRRRFGKQRAVGRLPLAAVLQHEGAPVRPVPLRVVPHRRHPHAVTQPLEIRVGEPSLELVPDDLEVPLELHHPREGPAVHVPVGRGGETGDVGAGLLDALALVVNPVHAVGERETKRVAHAVDGAAVVGDVVWGEFEGFLERGFGWCARGDAGRVGGPRRRTRGRSCHSLGGNAERSASSICRPKGTSVSVAAARTRTVRTPRGAFVPAGTGARASAVGHRREASAGHRRRHHHRHLSLVCRWSRHERCVSLVCPPSSRHSSFYPKVPEQARASAARAASRRRMKILFLRPAAKKPVGTFTAIPLGYLDPLIPARDTPVRNFGRQEEARIATASS